ncbi:hypothetical protein KP509_38G053600 [Ceratopteris richardii]|uniref:Protein CHUP1, chloroplastic n=1 Tax=Ceratopteris richardii TaxID=49495 RepID=A0A8T2Q4M4_CERRI|nr:hypothetical protein KP509_38G053600 [Ceratopteris richardii]
MFIRVILAIVFSYAAVTLAQRKVHQVQDPEPADPSGEKNEDGKEIYNHSNRCSTTKEKEEDESIGDLSTAEGDNMYEEDNQVLLDDFEDLVKESQAFLSGLGISRAEYDVDDKVELQNEGNTKNNEASRISGAPTLSFDKESRGSNQESSRDFDHTLDKFVELQKADQEEENMKMEAEKQLNGKTSEIERHKKMASLQEEVLRLSKESDEINVMKQELEATYERLEHLQRARKIDANGANKKLPMLKRKVNILQEREMPTFKGFMEQESQIFRERDLHVMNLQRTVDYLGQQKQDLIVELSKVESKIVKLSSEDDSIAEIQSEISELRQIKEDLYQVVEGLQLCRLHQLQEIVHLRWVNACLRYELRKFKVPCEKFTAVDLTNSLSPISQDQANKLMIEYGFFTQKTTKCAEEDSESIPCFRSTVSEGDLDGSSFHRWRWKHHSYTRKIFRTKDIKNWFRRKVRNLSSLLDQRYIHKGSKTSLENTVPSNNSDLHEVCSVNINVPKNYSDHLSASNSNYALQQLPLEESSSSEDIMSRFLSSISDEKHTSFKDDHKLEMERETDLRVESHQPRIGTFTEKSAITSGSPLSLRAIHNQPCFQPPGSTEVHVIKRKQFKRAPAFIGLNPSLRRWAEEKDVTLRTVDMNISDSCNTKISEDRSTFYPRWHECHEVEHFARPQYKVDTITQSTLQYQDLESLENEVSSFEDDPGIPSELSFKKMQALLKKVEKSVSDFLKTHHMASEIYNIPTL